MGTLENRADPAHLLETMLLVRGYEERLAALNKASGLPGTCIPVGQEASAVGVVAALAGSDLILTNHRSAGHLLARGADPGRLLAEVMGKASGYCKGKGGSLHISAKELGVLLTSTIVGGALSLAAGVALAQKMLKRDGIVVCFFGDGDACEGVFHESLKLASVWNLPILYVCENNQWQSDVHRRETMSGDHLGTWAAGYGMASAAVDGNDIGAVLETARTAAESVRAGGRPFLFDTYAYCRRGHFEPDDQAYVDPEELAAWRERDPIARCKAKLVADGALGPGDLAAIEARVGERIEAAVAFAAAAPFPELSELTTDVYA